jgi:MOSC domain-containing protein YiiM
MAYLFQKTGRTGWYYRVLETGTVKTGDRIGLLERTNPDWTVARVTSARLTRRISEEDARCLSSLTSLAEGWRKAFERMAEGDRREDTSARLGTG